MFKVSLIIAGAKFQPVKKPKAEKSSVELIAKSIEIELHEFSLNIMVSVRNTPLGIADGNMNPGKDFPHLTFIIHDDRFVQGRQSVLLKRGIRPGSICNHPCPLFRPPGHMHFFSGCLEIIENLHFNMTDLLSGAVFPMLTISSPGGIFCHYGYSRLTLTAVSSLERTVLFLCRSLRGEKAFVDFHFVAEFITSFPFTHDITKFVCHLPYRPALYLPGRDGTSGNCHEKHGCKPVIDRKVASLHDRSRAEGYFMTTVCTGP